MRPGTVRRPAGGDHGRRRATTRRAAAAGAAAGRAGAGPDLADLESAFFDLYGTRATALVRGPGRVNLIGEHTDYNDGFVLPMAIDREVRIALRPRGDRVVRMYAADVDASATFDLDALSRGQGWQEYLKGVAWALSHGEGLPLLGFDGVVSGNVPRGAGLSSSAALELATARAFQVSSGFAWDATRMALAGQRAENDWVGVNTGIMDQLVAARGQRGHALLIDCRTLDALAVPLPREHAVVVLDTMTRRGLVGTAYNERRAQCEEAARAFGVDTLRDVTMEELLERGDRLAELPRRRARHVIGENARTQAAADALRRGDAEATGRLMDASHESLRRDFEVSSPALDAIVRIARAAPGCRGARMTGAGFGGCAVALVETRALEAFVPAVTGPYRRELGLEPSVYVCAATDGASRLA